MLKLARDEIANINKQHELEINNMLDKLNLTRDSNLQKLKHDLKENSKNNLLNTTKAQVINYFRRKKFHFNFYTFILQLNRLQELEEVTVEQDNIISALNQKTKKLNTEVDTWKARYEILNQQSAENLAKYKFFI